MHKAIITLHCTRSMSDIDRKPEVDGTDQVSVVDKTQQSAKSGNPCAEMEAEVAPKNSDTSSDITVVVSNAAKSFVVYNVGDQVEGNFRAADIWKAGRIYKVNSDGTYNISYDDGNHEEYVTEVSLRLVGSVKLPVMPGIYSDGVQVHANFRGKGLWYLGTISRVHLDGSMNIDYDDGEEETFVPAGYVRMVAHPIPAIGHKLKEGYIVDANYMDSGEWHQAHVCFAHADGSYDVPYTDDTIEYRKTMLSLKVLIVSTQYDWNSNRYKVIYREGRCRKNVDPKCIIMLPWKSVDWLVAVSVVLCVVVVVLIIVESYQFTVIKNEL